ncbi:MAG TPA: hypothetical protein VHH73_13965 [Verrucomicrobiae bacterium]|nr:hypothetical protein [Verrucomicrobiae bacterium]
MFEFAKRSPRQEVEISGRAMQGRQAKRGGDEDEKPITNHSGVVTLLVNPAAAIIASRTGMSIHAGANHARFP